MAERKVVDSRGSVCPGPVLDLFKAYRQAQDGDEVELWATDPAAEPDSAAWAKRMKSEILGVSKADGVLHIAIRFHKQTK
ncbi:MAG TPA: sulfurtransferase TusA family protein [Candidatus Thermoplasmatota archaeon]